MTISMKESILKASKGLWKMFPIILGTILLVSLISTLVPPSFYSRIFTGNHFFDPFIGSLIGSISAGTPLVSYIIGGECVCPNCGYREPQIRGSPCMNKKCPKCGTKMTRG